MGKLASCTVLVILLLSSIQSTLTNRVENENADSPIGQLTTTQQGNQTAKYGGTLRIGFPGGLPQIPGNPLIDPWTGVSWLPTQISNNIFSWLVSFDENGSPIPDLTQSWEVSPDGCNYTFHLFQNVTWHDGVKFNATDVKFTYDTILYNQDVQQYWKEWLQACNVSSISIQEEYTVTISLLNPVAPAIGIIGWIPIIPWHLFEGTNLLTNPYNENPVGTGPFKFSNRSVDANMTLEAYIDHHRGRPYLDELIFYEHLDAATLADRLLDNTLDMVPDVLDPGRIEELNQVTGVSVRILEQSSWDYFVVNFSNPILADHRVRKALEYAINRTEICEVAYKGYATPAKGPVPPIFASWHNPNVTDYVCNLTIAEMLLDECGYSKENGTGIRFNVNVTVGGSRVANPAYWQAYEMVRSSWLNIGVNVTTRIGSGLGSPFDLWWIGYVWDTSDPDCLRGVYHTDGWGNFGGYSNDTVDYLFSQGRLTLNQTLRRQIYDELQLVLSEDLPSIFLWHAKGVTAHNNDFHGFTDYGFGSMLPIVLEEVWYDPTLSGEGNCPMLVSFVDSLGRRTGYDPLSGQAVNEIPNSTYNGLDADPQLVKIRSPLGEYTVECYGTGNGSYSLEIVNIALGYKHVDTPTSYIRVNETHTYYVRVHLDGSMDVFNPVADINNDFIIDIFDAILLASAFGSEPEDLNWDPASDLNDDDIVDIFDAIILAGHYGESW